MMKRSAIGAAMLLAAMTTNANHASAEWLSGTDLLERCQSKDDMPLGICLGYIDAVVDMAEIGEAPIPPGRILLPVGVQNGQLREIVVRYLHDHPKMLHYAASDLVYAALRKAFPGK